MERIIPPETYRFIEKKLHNRKLIEFEIEEWELSVKYPENKQAIRGVGYISDPTANHAIRLLNKPEHIKRLEKWANLIEQTERFCRQRGNRIFDIWYGQEWQMAVQAYTRNGIRKKTFENNRDKAVHFLLFRAIDAGLCGLGGNKKDKITD